MTSMRDFPRLWPSSMTLTIVKSKNYIIFTLKASIQRLSDIKRWLWLQRSSKRSTPIYKDLITLLCNQKRLMLVYPLTSLHKNLGFYSWRTKMNFLILLSFGFHLLKKPAKRNSDAYKPITRENLSAQHSKTSAKKVVLLLTTLHHICTRRIE